MSATHRYSVLGTGVEITAPAEIGAHFDRLFAPFKDQGADARSADLSLSVLGSALSGYRLVRNGQQLAASQSAPPILTRALTEINMASVAGLEQLAIHSGVVAGPSGVVAFPAVSGAGKSTLTAACLMAGLDYLSDEALILTDEGRVVPYPKPLSLSADARRLLGLGNGAVPAGAEEEVAMTAAELGASLGAGGEDLRHVVILRRGQGGPTLVRGAAGETVSTLLSHSFNHYLRPEAAYRLACRLAASAEVWRLTFDHPRPAAELIRERLST